MFSDYFIKKLMLIYELRNQHKGGGVRGVEKRLARVFQTFEHQLYSTISNWYSRFFTSIDRKSYLPRWARKEAQHSAVLILIIVSAKEMAKFIYVVSATLFWCLASSTFRGQQFPNSQSGPFLRTLWDVGAFTIYLQQF
jgi:hypothetical protein